MTNLTNETVKELFHIAGQIAYEEGRKNSWRWQWLFARIAIFKKFR